MITFLFIGCTEDEFIEDTLETSYTPQYNVKTQKLNWNQVIHKEQLEFTLKSIHQNELSVNSTSSSHQNDSTSNNPLQGMSIITEEVEYTSYSGGHTYTFATHSNTNNSLIKNLVLKANSDGNYDEYLFEYQLSDIEYESLQAGQLTLNDFLTRVNVIELEQGSTGLTTHSGLCSETTTVAVGCDGCNYSNQVCHDGSNITEWGGCVLLGKPTGPRTYITVTQYPCEGGGGGSTGGSGSNPFNPEGLPGGDLGNDNGSNNPGGSGSGIDNGNSDTNEPDKELDGPVTKPFKKIEILEDEFQSFLNDLDFELQLIFNDLPQVQQDEIKAFLLNNNYTQEAKEFVEAVINAWSENSDAEVDWALRYIFEINETIEFQNHPCVKSIKDDLKNSSKISEIIKKFEPTFPILHLEWGMFTNDNFGYTGQTFLNEEIDSAFININTESFAHVSPVVIANTIAHELIHAELYRKLKELVDDAQIITMSEYNALANNFSGIKDYVFKYGEIQSTTNGFKLISWSLTPNYSQAHHNQMADFYRDVLIDAMKSYDNVNNIVRYPNSEVFYEAISWAGLRSYSENGQTLYYDAWQNFVDQTNQEESHLPESERSYNVYIDIINQEYNNPSQQCQ